MDVPFSEALKSSLAPGNVLDDGVYDVEVKKAEPTTTKNGKLSFRLGLKVLSGPHANAGFTHRITYSPENPTALGFFFRDMAGFGVTQERFAEDPDPKQLASELVGNRARVTVRAKDPNSPFTNVEDVEYLGDASNPAEAASLTASAPAPSAGQAPASPQVPW